MRIALIYPARQMAYWPSLGLGYVAAMLEKEGHRVHIIDRNPTLMRGGDVDVHTRKSLNEIKPDMAGITATTPLMEDVIRVLRILNEETPGIPIVMGGPHVSALPEETLHRYPEIDIVVRLSQNVMPDGRHCVPLGQTYSGLIAPNGLEMSRAGALLLPSF